MRISIHGFESCIEVSPGTPSVLEIHDRTLFARVCDSLMSCRGLDTVEPYSVWEGEVEKAPSSSLFPVFSVLDLPWKNAALYKGLLTRFEEIVNESESRRSDIEDAFKTLQALLSRAALELGSDYRFTLEWDAQRCLKSLGLCADVLPDDSIIDRVNKFLLFCKDARLSRVIVFQNLKLFLSDSDIDLLYEQVKYLGVCVLLLENCQDAILRNSELKYVVDQDFILSINSSQSE